MRPYYDAAGVALYLGDCRDVLPTLPARLSEYSRQRVLP